ncbi:MAG TPA: arylsulfatase [Phycisphaerae bacterium]|nr:arylsulfatase [Phycisphaerae bacterium]HRY67275.1 arylsulfatase [Phycisphaerae bacterium]HSA26355.1 arylsulfatase [Phycisphaerae bacterium]
MIRWPVVIVAAFLAVPCLGCQSPSRPNVILILADDLGYGDLGCYGQKLIHTPRLDRMAAEGMRFTQFYAGSTVCAPSRCCFMTGLHTGHARVRGNSLVPLRPEDTTMAEVLKRAGYATGIVGKWGLGEPGTTGVPNLKGFDSWFGYLNQVHAHNYYPDYLWRDQERHPLDANRDGRKGCYTHDLFTEEALLFVQRNRHRPFFLYLTYTIPHANNELGAKTGDGMEVPDYGPYRDREWTSAHKGRAAMITRMDRDVGRLLDRLEELGLDRGTLVLFTSDNGPHKEGGTKPAFFNAGGPLRGIKRDLYEGGIRVPLVVRWPGQVQPGQVSKHVSAAWDFLPTMADLANVEEPAGLDGISMMPAIRGQPQRGHNFLYWEFHEGGFFQAVRMGDWKAVRKGLAGRMELYDLAADVGEQHNVAAAHPDIVARIEEYLKTARSESAEWKPK